MALNPSKTSFDWLAWIKSALITLLRDKIIKASLAKIATYTIVGPIKAWLLTFVIDELFEHLIIPMLNQLELEGKYRIDIIDGKKKVRLLEEARRTGNAEDVVTAFDQL